MLKMYVPIPVGRSNEPLALDDLQTAGVQAFADSFSSLLETIKNA